jgi:hypothetical protein
MHILIYNVTDISMQMSFSDVEVHGFAYCKYFKIWTCDIREFNIDYVFVILNFQVEKYTY